MTDFSKVFLILSNGKVTVGANIIKKLKSYYLSSFKYRAKFKKLRKKKSVKRVIYLNLQYILNLILII